MTVRPRSTTTAARSGARTPPSASPACLDLVAARHHPPWGASAPSCWRKLRLPGDAPDGAGAWPRNSEADAREILRPFVAGIDRRAHETPVEALDHARYLLQRASGRSADGRLSPRVRDVSARWARRRDPCERDESPTEPPLLDAPTPLLSFMQSRRRRTRLAFEFGMLDAAGPRRSPIPPVQSGTASTAPSLRSDQSRSARGSRDVEHRSAGLAADSPPFRGCDRAGRPRQRPRRRVVPGVADRVTLSLAAEPRVSLHAGSLDRSPIGSLGELYARCSLSSASVRPRTQSGRAYFHSADGDRPRAGGRGAADPPFLRVVLSSAAAGFVHHDNREVRPMPVKIRSGRDPASLAPPRGAARTRQRTRIQPALHEGAGRFR